LHGRTMVLQHVLNRGDWVCADRESLKQGSLKMAAVAAVSAANREEAERAYQLAVATLTSANAAAISESSTTGVRIERRRVVDQYEKAIKFFKKSLRMNPQHPDAARRLNDAVCGLARVNREEERGTTAPSNDASTSGRDRQRSRVRACQNKWFWFAPERYRYPLLFVWGLVALIAYYRFFWNDTARWIGSIDGGRLFNPDGSMQPSTRTVFYFLFRTVGSSVFLMAINRLVFGENGGFMVMFF